MNDDDNPTARAIRLIREDERARCIKVLEDLRDSEAISVARYAWVEILDALEAPTPPVASSPVGGEQ